MSRTVDPEELRRQRRERRRGNSGNDGALKGGEVDLVTQVDAPVIAQGRPQPMIRLEDLPEAVDAPDASGPLSLDEEERWELCQRSFQQFQQAWWVAAKALDIALRGKLWRRNYDTAEAFIQHEAKMSTSNAYRQIAGAEVAALLAAPARIELKSNDQSRMRDSEEARDSSVEQDSNDQSRMRDSSGVRDAQPLVISQRAAEALTNVREDYGAEAAASTYRTVAEVTGKDKVSQKTITGIVQQLPRKAEEELSEEDLAERVRDLARKQTEKEAAEKAAAVDPIQAFRDYVDATRVFARKTSGMAAAYKKAASADQAKADKLAAQLRDHMARAAGNFPDV